MPSFCMEGGFADLCEQNKEDIILVLNCLSLVKKSKFGLLFMKSFNWSSKEFLYPFKMFCKS
jgi:hypothetical protein